MELEGKTDEEIKTAVYEYVRRILEKLPDKEKEIEKILLWARKKGSQVKENSNKEPLILWIVVGAVILAVLALMLFGIPNAKDLKAVNYTKQHFTQQWDPARPDALRMTVLLDWMQVTWWNRYAYYVR